ncbi:hypothetical protein IMZ31_20400 (plasmid) [Pontibacillus sp. ALD_SL1]|uniref:hypothetical protein n=1 Tax=Pontibacillus sp. ALD_SL1 TaxID=2777185 RepID=UPI001A971AB1|nr:hypothetical protein [Pontibacillus sp. ALD_SL1]QST02912.1 hypothetical protein IMZ31_20400 [Pontibacillus sp. ALD_SL1]
MKRWFTYKWFLALVVLAGWLHYQVFFTWEEAEPLHEETSDVLNERDVITVIIEQKQYGGKNSGFDSLKENLETWSFDRENKVLDVKFEGWLPNERTKVLVVYDRRIGNLQRFNDVLPIATFPYQYFIGDDPLIAVYEADGSGTVRLIYNGRRIELKNGDSYSDWSFEGFQVTHTSIVNYGPLPKSNIVLRKE